jgi:hypothetical protein
MLPRFVQILLSLIFIFSLSVLATAQDGPLSYEITGRVVDEDGKPISGALVGMRVPSPWSPDAFYLSNTEKDGRFRLSDTSNGPADHATYWVSAPPSDAHAAVDFMFGRLSYLDASFKGQTVPFNGKQKVDIGDIRVQAAYRRFTIRILDSKGAPLSPESKDWENLRLMIRDARGDMVHEGGITEAARRKDKSAIVLAMPEGSWEIAVGVFGDSFNWTPLDRQVVIPRGGSGEPTLEATVKLSNSDCTTLPTASGASLTVEEARREIERRKLPYTEEEFVERAHMGNKTVVKLFLDAGMAVDARDKRGQTALITAAGPWPGYADVICLLIGAGADVNAKDFDGKTALFNSAGMVNSRIMELLLKKGADVNAQTANGWTPLMIAAQAGQANTVKVLLDAGADVTLKNNQGKTALSVAFRHEGNEVVSLLEKAAAQSRPGQD